MNNLKIIYQDGSILVVDKPPGLVVTTSESHTGPTLEDILRRHYDKLEYHNKNKLDRMGIVHRLDKETSGVIVVAKTQLALENLQAQFKNRLIKKEYLALVHGLVTDSGKVEGSIGRNPQRHDKFSVMENGREAITEYSPDGNFQFSIFNFQKIFNDLKKTEIRKLERMNYNQFTLLRCFPQTGRTHQIRVHLKYAGFPIVADEKYGGRKMYRLDIKWCPRLFLHAKKLGFYHPGSGKWMEFESELPEDLKEALSKLSS